MLLVKLIEPPCTERYARWCERSEFLKLREIPPTRLAQKTGMKLALYISINKKVGGEYFGRPVSCNTWKIQQRADKKY